MIDQLRQAAQQALEALEADELDMVDDGSGNMVFQKEQAITALKAALAMHQVSEFAQAQEQQAEPVALQYPQKDIDWQREQQIKAQASTPPQRTWVGLTDEEIENAISDGFARGLDDGNVPNKIVINYVRVIEATLKERNHD